MAMAVFPFRNIRAKATLLILVLLAATTFVSYAITVRVMNSHVTDRVIRTAESLGRSIAPPAGFLIGAQDLLGLDYMVYQVKTANTDIRSIGILGPDRDIIVHSDIKERGRKMEPAGGEILERNRGRDRYPQDFRRSRQSHRGREPDRVHEEEPRFRGAQR